jgi:hypothetical protein
MVNTSLFPELENMMQLSNISSVEEQVSKFKYSSSCSCSCSQSIFMFNISNFSPIGDQSSSHDITDTLGYTQPLTNFASNSSYEKHVG